MKAIPTLVAAGLFLVAQLNSEAQAASSKTEYTGMFLGRNGSGVIDPDQSGPFKITVSDEGKIRGKFQFGPKHHSTSGEFDSQGFARFFIYVSHTKYSGFYVVTKKKVPKWMVTMNLTNAGEQVSGQVTLNQPDGWTADLSGNRAGYDGKSETAPQAGQYTVVFPGHENSETVPAGTGYATVQVDEKGKVKFKGELADGTKVSQSVLLGRNGAWPLYLQLYGYEGALAGWVHFTNQAASDVAGSAQWIKPKRASGPLYPDGFTNAVGVIGSLYFPLPPDGQILNWTNAQVVIGGGNLVTPLTNNITIGPGNQIVDLGGQINNLTLKIQTKDGLFQGSFVPPGSGWSTKIAGALLQEQNRGAGFFPNDHVSGYVLIESR